MKAIVGDSWAVLRAGVAAVLGQAGVDVVAQVEAGRDLLALGDRDDVELVVVGHLHDLSPVTAVAALLVARPELRVLVLLDNADRGDTIGVLDAGAAAIVARSANDTDLREGVLRARRGERFVAPALLAQAFGPSGRIAAPQLLTARERAVLEQLAQGRSNRQIAQTLFIGEATVKTHLSRIYQKLEVENRVQAVGRARERNLLGGGSSTAALT
jgi:DNA-binding NarL/FixJ family response regulator